LNTREKYLFLISVTLDIATQYVQLYYVSSPLQHSEDFGTRVIWIRRICGSIRSCKNLRVVDKADRFLTETGIGLCKCVTISLTEGWNHEWELGMGADGMDYWNSHNRDLESGGISRLDGAWYISIGI
jgi:hypothetical protein